VTYLLLAGLRWFHHNAVSVLQCEGLYTQFWVKANKKRKIYLPQRREVPQREG
jgi:hypothetical protein